MSSDGPPMGTLTKALFSLFALASAAKVFSWLFPRPGQGYHDTAASKARKIALEEIETTIPAILDLVEESRKCWLSSKCRDSLVSHLQQHAPKGGWNIERCILFGLGHIATLESPEYRHRALLCRTMQLAVFLDIASLVQNKSGKAPELFAQDPWFTSADREFLSCYGFQVVKEPEGERSVSEQTFAMLPFTGADCQVLGGVNQPALLIGNPYAHILTMSTINWGGNRTGATGWQVHQRVVDAADSYVHHPLCTKNRFFPDMFSTANRVGRGYRFHDLWVYVRKGEHMFRGVGVGAFESGHGQYDLDRGVGMLAGK